MIGIRHPPGLGPMQYLLLRIENAGDTGKVNICGIIYHLIKYKFDCRHRGKIEAKNKGAIDMYLLNPGLIRKR